MLFVANYAIFVVRCRRGTDGHFRSTRVLATVGAVVLPLSVIRLNLRWWEFGPGFYSWCGAAILLAVGVYLLRAPSSKHQHPEVSRR